MRSLLLLVFCSLASVVAANNIMIENVSLTGQNAVGGTTQIQFDLSWENSWKISVGPANYDAAWVFAKYRVNGNTWRHATLNTAGAQAAPGSTIEVVDNVGAFIYRSADGSGDVAWDDLQLQWDYEADGVDVTAVVDVQVFAIEMVYVPEGAFSMGTSFLDQGNLNGNFFTLAQALPVRIPYQVQSEAAITVSPAVGDLFYDNSEGISEDGIGDEMGPIPAAFPKGFAAFYCMKYEVSQDQWVSFFNTLTQNQKVAVDVTGPTGKNTDEVSVRNGVSWPDEGNATTSFPYVALNYVNTVATLTYLDWAGLRPMTELEYEKACRGTLPTVPGEFAWGNSNRHVSSYTLVDEGTTMELITNPGEGTGNAAASGTLLPGPLRTGIFAASAVNPTREETGGSYYGIMELTGNVYERAITVGNPQGRAFTGNHGDGVIASNGMANQPSWPSTALGIGYRGGSYANNVPFLRVSDRTDAANEITNGNTRLGFRGVRTAQ